MRAFPYKEAQVLENEYKHKDICKCPSKVNVLFSFWKFFYLYYVYLLYLYNTETHRFINFPAYLARPLRYIKVTTFMYNF